MNKLVPATILFAVTILLGIILNTLYNVPNAPEFDVHKWWGVGTRPHIEDDSIRKFKIDFNNTMIQDLKQRIKNRRPLTPPLEGIQSQYGINTLYLESVLDYWLNEYNFKEREDRLNRFPHYKTRIQGLDIHYIKVTPKVQNGAKILPLLMLHGWPSSSKEFEKVIPMLTEQKPGYNFMFEVIAADLPGFGFSEGTSKPGLSPAHIGIIMRNLMRRLGYKTFYVQAGDWGSQSASHMATLFPDEILGYHTNMPISSRKISTIKLILGSLFPTWIADERYVNRIYPLSKFLEYLLREFGYFHLQATKPDTIGVALTDSPVGLAAYIMEKMAMCSDRNQLDTPHGGLENLDIDDVLDTITIVWTNNCVVTSMRLYAEGTPGLKRELDVVHDIPTKVPTAVLNFLHEVVYQPDWILRDKFHNLVRSTTLDFGGHFAALQTPREFADDVIEAGADFLKFHESYQQNMPL